MSAQDLINDISEILASGWSTLFQKDVILGASQWPELEACAEQLQGGFVRCDIIFSGDIEGTCKAYIKQIDALTMVGMMLSMGADDALVQSTRDGELGAEELDALQEVLNQTAASMATCLREKLSCSVQSKMENMEAIELAGDFSGAEGQTFTSIDLTLEGFDLSTFFFTFDDTLNEKLSQDDSVVDVSNDALDALSESSDAPAAPAQETGTVLDKLQKIKHVKVQAQAILAEREIEFEELLKINVGSVIEFWKNCDDPAELCVGDSVLADGEIVTYDTQQFGIRLFNMAPQKAEYKRRKK